MIVRAIFDDPMIANKFDFFNDLKDTECWLFHLEESPKRSLALLRLRLAAEVESRLCMGKETMERADAVIYTKVIVDTVEYAPKLTQRSVGFHSGYCRGMVELQHLLEESEG